MSSACGHEPRPARQAPGLMARRRRIARVLDRLGWLCFQHPPVDYDALNAHMDYIAGLDA
jgi:hypothetical protein